MSVRLFFMFIISQVLLLPIIAQTDSLQILLSDNEQENVDLHVWLESFHDNLIDINSISENELKKIPLLNKRLIKKILTARPLKKKRELRQILGNKKYKQIGKFVRIKDPVRYPQILFKHRLKYTLEQNQALKKHLYLGSPFESYSRLQLKLSKGISAGALIQKDVGENSFMDHISGFLSWYNPEIPIRVILGNYYLHAAEGLILSSPYPVPKTFLLHSQSRYPLSRLKSFLSSNESDSFMGIAVETRVNNILDFTVFYSNSLKDGLLLNNMFLKGIDRSGYHRTPSEILRRDILRERVIGGIVFFPLPLSSQAGIVYLKVDYSPPIQSVSSGPAFVKKTNSFSGTWLECYSFFYAIQHNQFRLSGEIIPFTAKVLSQQHTLNLKISDLNIIGRWWYLARDLQSPFGRSFVDPGPFPGSRTGFFAGLSARPFRQFRVSTYWTHDKDLWRTYFDPLPLSRKSSYIRFEYLISSKDIVSLRVGFRGSQSFSGDPAKLITESKNNLRLQLVKYFGTSVRIRSRFEKVYLSYSGGNTAKNGYNFHQDLFVHLKRWLSFWIRFSSFTTTDYDARIYEYEMDLPGVYSNRVLHGEGIKWYIVAAATISSNFKLWLKYRRMEYGNIGQISSGQTAIDGSIRQDVHFQLEIRY